MITKVYNVYMEHTINNLVDMIAEPANKQWFEKWGLPENKCIGCGGRATKTNNTLCQSCWNDAECFDNE